MKQKKKTPKKIDSKDSIDIEELSFSHIVNVIKKLKIKSIIWLITIFVFSHGIFFSLGGFGNKFLERYFKKSNEIQNVDFMNNFDGFLNNEILDPLISSIQQNYTLDGLENTKDLKISLIYQTKSQKGFSEFLAGNRSISLNVTYDNEEQSFLFKWDERNNLIPEILNRYNINYNSDNLKRYNSEMNLFGVVRLPNDVRIVRDIDGGINVFQN